MENNIPNNIDIVVSFQPFSTVWSFLPVSDFAKQWIDLNVQTEPWQWSGDAFVVDHRPAKALLDYILDEGLTAFHPSLGLAKRVA